jgi:hypothetical protein
VSLWTPDGERPVRREPDPQPAAPAGGPGAQDVEEVPGFEDLSPEDQARVAQMQAEMEEVRQGLLEAPASVVIANHAMGVYELAAIHLTAPEPNLSEAVLAIDALAALVDGLAGRLGEAEATLQGALSQLRAAYLEVAKVRDPSG